MRVSTFKAEPPALLLLRTGAVCCPACGATISRLREHRCEDAVSDTPAAGKAA